MMQTMFIECLLFLFVIIKIDGSEVPWKYDNLSLNERTMEAILESCNENDSSSRPIVIIGDYDGRGYRSSIIRLNHSFEIVKYSKKNEFKQLRASKIIISGGSPEQIQRSIEKLQETIWWDRMAHFFIFGSCRKAKRLLRIAFRKGLLNPIYICTVSNDVSRLLTTNRIGNHAPLPWKKLTTGIGKYHVFYQDFESHVSCTNLYYDKTRQLNGFQMKVIGKIDEAEFEVKPGEEFLLHFPETGTVLAVHQEIMITIIKKLNATGILGYVDGVSLMARCENRTADFVYEMVDLSGYPRVSCLFPFLSNDIIVVVKLRREVSTLSKIRHLWSTLVLILAAIALVILYLILTIINHNFSLAMLELTRLLIYSSILGISGRHSFRIYLTTMLIFMVISNGVFQGKIAAFLTTREREHAIRTIGELVKLDYKIYTYPGMADGLNLLCPKCKLKELRGDMCINRVLNSPRHACAVPKTDYETHFNHLSLDQVEEPLMSSSRWTFCHQKEWLFADSTNRIVMRLVESGLIDFWNERHTHKARRKRQEREAEWSSTEYRPVKLYKLAFAFYGLVFGLLISTIVFLLELLVANYRICKKKNHTPNCFKKFRKRKVTV